ncbi:MAG: ribonuclease HI family protein [Candidatus Levybacteria bacterium]|nr:ribonuclease HI family protein [Candidatus Levybacteria bacterium]
MICVYTDGGARGNPGAAAIGVFITDEKEKVIVEFGKAIGEATNNVAEYEAVNAALRWLLLNKHVLWGQKEIHVFLDSLLLVSQINRLYKVKSPNLRLLLFSLREKESLLSLPIRYFHIPREKNKRADKLVNIALDQDVDSSF